jgi:predicted RNase H-like HicB family nuclease
MSRQFNAVVDAISLDQLMERIMEAIELCLVVAGTAPESHDFVGIQRVTVDL